VNFFNAAPFNITGGFVAGRNYLDFNICNAFAGSNIYSIYQNPCGFYVAFDPANILFSM
jgi:hypothetical protein